MSFKHRVKTNLITWLTKGGVTDAKWNAFKTELTGKVGLDKIHQVFQAAYNRYIGE